MPSRTSSKVDQSLVDVIVVGAGFSGLAAAAKLTKEGKSVLVLEALDRVGGKVYDRKIPGGGHVEAGAEFIGPCQDRILQLAEELGVATFPTYAIGNAVCYAQGERYVYDPQSETIPALQQESLVQMITANNAIDTMARTIDVVAPWNHADAALWDSMTFATWLDTNVTDTGARALWNLSIRTLLSSEPADLSLLQVLVYVSRAGNENTIGNLQRLISVSGGAQESRFTGGPQIIAIKLAENLGDKVQLNSPVRLIRRRQATYEVTGDSWTRKARHVIVALSPPLAGRILYDPPLPAQRDQLTQHMPMGSLGKAIAIYKTPFWRADGLSGVALGLDGVSVQATFDSSPEDGSFGALLGFLEGNDMRQLDSKSEKEIQDAVVEDYVKYFGPKAREVEHWVIQRWDNEEFARGGHFAICPPNVLTQYGPAIAEPVGNIFFAGTEASPYWAGFMEGAIRAGEIAAERICQLSARSKVSQAETIESVQSRL